MKMIENLISTMHIEGACMSKSRKIAALIEYLVGAAIMKTFTLNTFRQINKRISVA